VLDGAEKALNTAEKLAALGLSPGALVGIAIAGLVLLGIGGYCIYKKATGDKEGGETEGDNFVLKRGVKVGTRESLV